MVFSRSDPLLLTAASLQTSRRCSTMSCVRGAAIRERSAAQPGIEHRHPTDVSSCFSERRSFTQHSDFSGNPVKRSTLRRRPVVLEGSGSGDVFVWRRPSLSTCPLSPPSVINLWRFVTPIHLFVISASVCPSALIHQSSALLLWLCCCWNKPRMNLSLLPRHSRHVCFSHIVFCPFYSVFIHFKHLADILSNICRNLPIYLTLTGKQYHPEPAGGVALIEML